MNRRRKLATALAVAIVVASASPAFAAPGGNGNGNGNSHGFGYYGGRAGGAPLPALGATILGQIFGVGGFAFLFWRRRTVVVEPTSTEQGTHASP